MSDGGEFEKIRIIELVEEESGYDPESHEYDFTLRLSAEPPKLWAQFYKDAIDEGAPDGLPVQGEIRGDTVVVRGTTLGRFEGTLLRLMHQLCKRTNDDYVRALAQQAKDAEKEAAHRAEMEAQREKGQKAIAELAERIKSEGADDDK